MQSRPNRWTRLKTSASRAWQRTKDSARNFSAAKSWANLKEKASNLNAARARKWANFKIKARAFIATLTWENFKEKVSNFFEPTFCTQDIPDFWEDAKKYADSLGTRLSNKWDRFWHHFAQSYPIGKVIDHYKNPNNPSSRNYIDVAYANPFWLHLKTSFSYIYGSDSKARDIALDNGFVVGPEAIGRGSRFQGFKNLVDGKWLRYLNPIHLVNFLITGFAKALLLGLCDGFDRFDAGTSNSFNHMESSLPAKILKGIYYIAFGILEPFVKIPCKFFGDIFDGLVELTILAVKGTLGLAISIPQVIGWGIKKGCSADDNTVYDIELQPIPQQSVPEHQVSVAHEPTEDKKDATDQAKKLSSEQSATSPHSALSGSEVPSIILPLAGSIGSPSARRAKTPFSVHGVPTDGQIEAALTEREQEHRKRHLRHRAESNANGKTKKRPPRIQTTHARTHSLHDLASGSQSARSSEEASRAVKTVLLAQAQASKALPGFVTVSPAQEATTPPARRRLSTSAITDRLQTHTPAEITNTVTQRPLSARSPGRPDTLSLPVSPGKVSPATSPRRSSVSKQRPPLAMRYLSPPTSQPNSPKLPDTTQVEGEHKKGNSPV